MRVIAGIWRGRKIRAHISEETKPTSDRTRETIFNIIANQLRIKGETFQDHTVLDVFAGTGAMGLEALSRGATHATFIERARQVVHVLRQSINDFNTHCKTEIISSDVYNLTSSLNCFSIIFLDPPYDNNYILPTLNILEKNLWLCNNALIMCEIGPQELIEFPPHFTVIRQRRFTHCQIILLRYKQP